MNTSHSSPDHSPGDPTPDRPDSGARPVAGEEIDLAAEHMTMLRKLAQLSMGLAEAVQRQALERAARESADGIERGDLTVAFARAARSARLSMALAAKFDAERRTAQREDAAERARQARAAEHLRKQGEKRWVKRTVLQAMATDERLSEKDAARIRGELDERLEDETLYEKLSERPIEEIVSHLSRALGIVPDWVRLAAADAAARKAQAGSHTSSAAEAEAAGPQGAAAGPEPGGGPAGNPAAPPRVANNPAAPQAEDGTETRSARRPATGHDPP